MNLAKLASAVLDKETRTAIMGDLSPSQFAALEAYALELSDVPPRKRDG